MLSMFSFQYVCKQQKALVKSDCVCTMREYTFSPWDKKLPDKDKVEILLHNSLETR